MPQKSCDFWNWISGGPLFQPAKNVELRHRSELVEQTFSELWTAHDNTWKKGTRHRGMRLKESYPCLDLEDPMVHYAAKTLCLPAFRSVACSWGMWSDCLCFDLLHQRSEQLLPQDKSKLWIQNHHFAIFYYSLFNYNYDTLIPIRSSSKCSLPGFDSGLASVDTNEDYHSGKAKLKSASTERMFSSHDLSPSSLARLHGERVAHGAPLHEARWIAAEWQGLSAWHGINRWSTVEYSTTNTGVLEINSFPIPEFRFKSSYGTRNYFWPWQCPKSEDPHLISREWEMMLSTDVRLFRHFWIYKRTGCLQQEDARSGHLHCSHCL